jgi:hypothetical protein
MSRYEGLRVASCAAMLPGHVAAMKGGRVVAVCGLDDTLAGIDCDGVILHPDDLARLEKEIEKT